MKNPRKKIKNTKLNALEMWSAAVMNGTLKVKTVNL